MAIELPTYDEGLEKLRKFSKVRLVAMDLDGTLFLNENPKVYVPIRELYSSLRHKYQVHLTFATGRTLTAVRPFLDQLQLEDNFPLILYNGSLTVSNTTFQAIGHTWKISRESLRKIIDLSFPLDVPVLAYYYGHQFGMKDPEESVMGWSKSRTQETEFNGLEVQWSDPTEPILSEPLAVLLDITSLAVKSLDSLNSLRSMSGISITRSGNRFIEVRPSDSNKGAALRYVAQRMGLSRNQILALGDGDNDVEMLRWAGIGVAVLGASDNAMRECDYVCKYGAAKGAVQLLRLVKDSRRYFKDEQNYQLVSGD